MKMNRKLVLILSLVLSLALATGGTLAYLSDTDADVNTMTLGNVHIEQHELQRTDGIAYNATAVEGNLVPFEQGQMLFPTTYTNTSDYTAQANDLFEWGPYVTAEGAANGLWHDNLTGAIDKFVFVENTGKSDCYYRTWLAFECPEGMEYSEGYKKQFMMNTNGNDRFVWENHGYATIAGTRYLIMSATYTEILKPGEISRPSLLQVVMTHNCTNAHMELLGDTYEILALSQGVQAAGFNDADTALKAAFGEEHPWKEGSASVSTNEELQAALTADKENITVELNADLTFDVTARTAKAMGGESTKSVTIIGNGHTLTFNQTNSDWNNIATNNDASLTIIDAKLTNSGHNDGPWNRHDLNFACDVELINVTSDKAMAFSKDATLTNVTISDANTSDTYAIWIEPNGQTVTLNGCTIDMIACTDGRGIKIDEQYVSAPEKVTLKVSDTTFKTEEKSAILVKSKAGADIVLSNVDITAVAADRTNPVWVDEASAAYDELVVVTGGSKIVEP